MEKYSKIDISTVVMLIFMIIIFAKVQIKHITLYQINILFETFFYCISDRISLHKYKIKNY
jgi:hypothetical protein